MTRKTHDADLCERIRELEKRVEELEARPTYVHLHYGTSTWPQWTWTIPNTTTAITYAKGISTDSTTYIVGDIP